MLTKIIRILLVILTASVALTAIGGGIAMLAGADRFPLEWLEGTPFKDYTLPALLLAVFVGGSALLAAVMVFTGRAGSALAALAAGVILAGYISVEVLILKQVPPGPTSIEVFYFWLGLVVMGLGVILHFQNRQKAAPKE